MQKSSLLLTLALLSACNGNDLIPDRSPDYRQSRVGKHLELPPNFVRTGQQDQLVIPQLEQQHSIATYQDYQQQNLKRDARGYIEVLPELHGVRVVENAGTLPYLETALSVEDAWKAAKRFWEQQGIRLDVQDTALGVMETAWLEDKTKLPRSGLSGMLSFLHDSGERDRYRLRFSREGSGSKIVVMHRKSEDLPMDEKENIAFRWVETNNVNPEFQLEMTRRLAVQLSRAYQLQHGKNAQAQDGGAFYQHTTVDGQNALMLNLPYQSAFRAVGIALDRASFALEHKDAKRGLYRVQYQPQQGKPTKGLLHQWFSKQEKPKEYPRYDVRFIEQGNGTVVVVHNTSGKAVAHEEADVILNTILQHW